MEVPVSLPLLNPVRWWECPSCHGQHVTNDPRAITPMHNCRAMRGLLVPYVQVQNNHGISRGSVRLVALERPDFEGQEVGLNHDAEGRSIYAVHTERSDGSNDCFVFPAAAVSDSKAHK